MQAEPEGGAFVAAVAAQHRGQPGEQPPLAFVEQAGEALRRGLRAGLPPGRQRRRGQRQGQPGGAAGGDLALLPPGVGRAVQGLSFDLHAGQLAGLHQPAQRGPRMHAEQLVEFAQAPAARRGLGQRGRGGAQRAAHREADRTLGPQAVPVEAGAGPQGVVTPAVGVAGEGVQFVELAEDGAFGRAAERIDELGHGGDAQAAQGVGHGGGGEGNRAHGAIMS